MNTLDLLEQALIVDKEAVDMEAREKATPTDEFINDFDGDEFEGDFRGFTL